MPWLKRSTPTDTGWLDVSADLRLGATGVLHVRRVGMYVHWRLRDFTAGTAHAFYWPPAGLNAPSVPSSYPPQTPENPSPIFLDQSGRFTRPINAAPLAAGRWWEGTYLLPAGTPPLTSYPGEEVS